MDRDTMRSKLAGRFTNIKRQTDSIVKLAAVAPTLITNPTLGRLTRMKEYLYNEYVAAAMKTGVHRLMFVARKRKA